MAATVGGHFRQCLGERLVVSRESPSVHSLTACPDAQSFRFGCSKLPSRPASITATTDTAVSAILSLYIRGISWKVGVILAAAWRHSAEENNKEKL
ncbi:hypothetical protein RB213_009574 [Colletotrichum asianum]